MTCWFCTPLLVVITTWPSRTSKASGSEGPSPLSLLTTSPSTLRSAASTFMLPASTVTAVCSGSRPASRSAFHSIWKSILVWFLK